MQWAVLVAILPATTKGHTMGTRAVIEVRDESGTFSVYQHWDGYPDSVKGQLQKARGWAWALPRFEADEYAAAYIAANKLEGGNIRITKGWRKHSDIEYRYMVEPAGDGLGLWVTVYMVHWADNDRLRSTTLETFSILP
jgi:hypothetical protein